MFSLSLSQNSCVCIRYMTQVTAIDAHWLGMFSSSLLGRVLGSDVSVLC